MFEPNECSDSCKLSRLARWGLAGWISHALALSVICCPALANVAIGAYWTVLFCDICLRNRDLHINSLGFLKCESIVHTKQNLCMNVFNSQFVA